MDSYLTKKINQYDKWMNSGGITSASKVIPVSESLDATEWVMPSEQALEVLADAGSFAVTACECRTRYGNCDHPREVCFLLGATADKYVEKGRGRRVSLDEAKEILKQADASGLVHLTLFKPDQETFALCSCCACCCHDFQIIKQLGRHEIMARSDFRAVTDQAACVHCGVCTERCPFQARRLETDENGKTTLMVDDGACLGCGLCVTPCPTGAVAMERR